MKNKQEIIESLRQHKQELTQQFGIEELALFGSFANDEQNAKSDIDLLVLKMQRKNALTLIKAQNFLSKLLCRNVDLGLIDSLRPFIRNRVEKEMINV
jgi:uncharacterized protein